VCFVCRPGGGRVGHLPGRHSAESAPGPAGRRAGAGALHAVRPWSGPLPRLRAQVGSGFSRRGLNIGKHAPPFRGEGGFWLILLRI
jgi:hypothetical protein